MKWNKAKIIKLSFFILLTMISPWATGQTIMSRNKDSLILIYLNSKTVLDNFFKTAKFTNDTLIFLDPKKILKNVNLTTWKEHPIKIITKSPLIDSINTFGVDNVLKKRNDYFLLEKFKWEKKGI